ncbi:hypothetical protein BC834DRAFT_546041 [Gloeopeniophorella convolvens]|nr:hypothetical protein BC834DRAFT_546041 [Gloeopeniophorella convolvens]
MVHTSIALGVAPPPVLLVSTGGRYRRAHCGSESAKTALTTLHRVYHADVCQRCPYHPTRVGPDGSSPHGSSRFIYTFARLQHMFSQSRSTSPLPPSGLRTRDRRWEFSEPIELAGGARIDEDGGDGASDGTGLRRGAAYCDREHSSPETIFGMDVRRRTTLQVLAFRGGVTWPSIPGA